MKAALFALIFLVSACAQIDYAKAPPKDWPQMRVEYLEVAAPDFPTYCAPQDIACARARFDTKVCYVVTRKGTHLAGWMKDHEEAHCKGRDHIGDDLAARAWERYKKTGRHQ